MIRHAIAAAAVLGLLIGMQPVSASAQTSSSTTATQAKKPMAKKSTAKKTMAKKPAAQKTAMASKPMKGNHRLDNVADKLNACMAKPVGERQPCMDQALKG
jgi:hypothetical protein